MDRIKSNDSLIVFEKKGIELFNKSLIKNNYSKLFVLVDENTRENCLFSLINEVDALSDIKILEIKSGEINKNISTCENLWGQLSKYNADRNSALINLGGGVICDLGGFVASTYKRGIHFYNIPTTLLSMVDASVGGKTGIDFGLLKNQIGVFNNPEIVLIMVKWLKTLGENQILSGFSEMLKHGLILDRKHWQELSLINKIDINNLNQFILKSILLKNSVVLDDPNEENKRKILNFGHTFGHAIESNFLGKKHELLHGEALAIGMILETYLSYKVSGLSISDCENIIKTINHFFKKTKIKDDDINKIIDLLIHDKKTIDGKINFVLLSEIGVPKIDITVNKRLFKEVFKFYND